MSLVAVNNQNNNELVGTTGVGQVAVQQVCLFFNCVYKFKFESNDPHVEIGSSQNFKSYGSNHATGLFEKFYTILSFD